MAGYYAPSYLGSTDNRSASGHSVDQSVRNHLQEVEDNNVQEDEIEDPPLSPHQGDNSSLRDQSYLPYVRGPLCPPGPESHSSKTKEDTQTLRHSGTQARPRTRSAVLLLVAADRSRLDD